MAFLLSRDYLSGKSGAIISLLLSAAICAIAILNMVPLYQDPFISISYGLIITFIGGMGMIWASFDAATLR